MLVDLCDDVLVGLCVAGLLGCVLVCSFATDFVHWRIGRCVGVL